MLKAAAMRLRARPCAKLQEFTNYMLFHAPGFNSSDGACEQGTWQRSRYDGCLWHSLGPLLLRLTLAA